MSAISYFVANMRVTRPTPKIAEKNPERLFSVKGEFHSIDEHGTVSTEPLTITSKDIDRDVAASPEFAIDRAAGTLTLPAGERGRKAAEGMSDDDILAMLASVREPEAVTEAPAEPVAEVAPEGKGK